MNRTSRLLSIVPLIIIGILPMIIKAQINRGVNFIHAADWNEVLKIAKSENKIIFIDAFATWCGPCKMMDKNVYPDASVGDYVGKNFIAVKVQFDQTPSDSENVKNWYQDAKYLMSFYHIKAFPTYLFINSDGKLVHVGTGYQDVTDFLKLLNTANNSDVNYAGLIERFKTNRLPENLLAELALKAKENHEDSIALEIAKIFKKKIIDQLEPSILLRPNLIEFFSAFSELLSIDDQVSRYMYKYPAKADLLLQNKGSSKLITDYLIRRDIIDPIIKPNGTYSPTAPDWDKLQLKLEKSFDISTAKSLITRGKIDWYSYKKDWDNVIKYTFLKMDSEGVDSTAMGGTGINNFIFFTVLKYAKDKLILEKAGKYMQVILKNNPKNDAWLDTYAAILYKMGRREEAILQETKALKIALEKNKTNAIKEYQKVINKMKNSQQTW